MMLKGILLALLLGCAEEAQETRTAPEYDYGGLRRPSALAPPKTDPVLPPTAPAASDPDPPAPKVDPCTKLCADLAEANQECGSLTASCNRLPTTNNDICRQKASACSAADTAQRRALACSCD